MFPLQKSEKRHFCINGKERLFLIPHCDHNEGTTGLKIFSFSQVLSLLLTWELITSQAAKDKV